MVAMAVAVVIAVAAAAAAVANKRMVLQQQRLLDRPFEIKKES